MKLMTFVYIGIAVVFFSYNHYNAIAEIQSN